MTPGRQLEYIADADPERTAVIAVDRAGNEEKLSYDALRRKSNQLAHFLRSKGVGPGSRVLVLYPNGIAHFIAAFAIWKTGACYVPISHKAADFEIESLCRELRPLVSFSEAAVPCAKLRLREADLSGVLEGQPDTFPEDVQSNPNLITVSGGTSGRQKFIAQTFPCGLDDGILRGWFYMSGMEFGQRQLLTGPLFHGAPHTVAFNGLFVGNTLVVPGSLSPEHILQLIGQYQIEYVQMVPTMMNRLAKLPGCTKEAFASVKALCHTGGACAGWLKEHWIGLLGAKKVFEIYSMTECVGITCIRGDAWLSHKGSVGRPVQGSSISIRDEAGRELPPGEIGEIYMTVPGNYRLTEYVNSEPLRELPGGFRSVGDMGFVDQEGYLYYADRRMDLVVVGGENVFVRQIEDSLLQHPKIRDAVVVGIPDEDMGHRLEAIIEAPQDIDREELRQFLAKRLSPYKIPKAIYAAEQLPKSRSGKTDRNAACAYCLQQCAAGGAADGKG